MASRGEKELACCVRGYHVYKDIWAAAIGEELECSREPTNMADRYAVAVRNEETLQVASNGHGSTKKTAVRSPSLVHTTKYLCSHVLRLLLYTRTRSKYSSKKCFVVKLYSCKIFSYIFCVRKYFHNEN